MFLAWWLHGCGGGVIKKLLPLHAELPPLPSLMLSSGSISGARCEKKNNIPLFNARNTLECAHVGKFSPRANQSAAGCFNYAQLCVRNNNTRNRNKMD
jgi:hypothetical protein